MARFWRRTGAAGTNIDETFTPEIPFQLEEIRIHLSADGVANDLTVTLDADASAAAEYNAVILSQAMAGVTDIVYQPDRPLQFSKDDELAIAWTKGADVIWGVEVIFNQTGF